jgi:AAA lid domain
MVVSDRRFADAMTVLQAHAFVHGRRKAIEKDVIILTHIFWDKPENLPKVRAIVAAAASQSGADMVTYEEVASDVWDTAMETGDMETAETKLTELLGSASRFTESGGAVVRAIKGYLHRVRQILRDRKELVLIEMPSKERKEYIYKLGATSATSWSANQLRQCGFHWYKKHGYWYHHGPKVDAKRQAYRNQITKEILRELKVVPRIRKIDGGSNEKPAERPAADNDRRVRRVVRNKRPIRSLRRRSR